MLSALIVVTAIIVYSCTSNSPGWGERCLLELRDGLELRGEPVEAIDQELEFIKRNPPIRMAPEEIGDQRGMRFVSSTGDRSFICSNTHDAYRASR